MTATLRHSLIALTLLAGTAQAEEIAVKPVTVATGYYKAEDCVPDADPKTMNECICKADIVKAQVTGVISKVATTINNQLSQVPEQLSSESCPGKAVSAPEPNLLINMAYANFETVYKSPSVLSVLVTYATGGAGAAHPIPGSEGYVFNLINGKTMDVASLLTQDQIAEANQFAHDELNKKYGDMMLSEAKLRNDAFLSDAGCENCTLYYTKEGWNMRFSVYAVAPYSAGEPTITIPTTIIPEPEALITRKK